MLHVNVNYKENDSSGIRNVFKSRKEIGSSSNLTSEEVEADTERHSLDCEWKPVLNSKEKRSDCAFVDKLSQLNQGFITTPQIPG